jgi:hypothetical protein
VARIRGALANLRAERAAHAEEQRRIRQQEQELRRRERETELARRAVLEAEQRRRAGEEERRLREQEWAVQRLREDEDRRRLLEEEKRLAANRAAAEVERLRIAQEQRQAEAERQRAAEEQRHAAEAKAPEQREPVAPQPAWSQSTVAMGMPPQAPVRDPASVAAEVDALQRTLATSNTPMVRPPRPRTQPIPRPRHLQSGRSRQWQRAALFASVLVLIVMIGFALAMRQSTPLSGSSNLLPQNAVQQEVPFGAATAIPAKPSPARARTPQPAAHPQASPAPSRPKAAVRSRRQRRRDYVAQDEVIIHHYGTKRAPAANAKTTAGVRHYSDME